MPMPTNDDPFRRELDAFFVELIEAALRERRASDAEYERLQRESLEVNRIAADIVEALPADAQAALMRYRETYLNLADQDMRYLYRRGYRDCIAFLAALDVL